MPKDFYPAEGPKLYKRTWKQNPICMEWIWNAKNYVFSFCFLLANQTTWHLLLLMKIKRVSKVLHQKKHHIHISIRPWIFFESNHAFTFLRHFFRATDLKIPEIVRTKYLMLSVCYSLAIKASVAYSWMALAHAETILEGLLQVAGIKLFWSNFKLSCLIVLEFLPAGS